MLILELLAITITIAASSIVAKDMKEAFRLLARSRNQLYTW